MVYIIKRQRSEGVNGIKKKFLSWKLFEENSTTNVHIKFQNYF